MFRALGTVCGFRGVVAPASLKEGFVLLQALSASLFPGRCCPGLIEGIRLAHPGRAKH